LSEHERLPKDEGSTSGCLKTLAVVLFLLIVIGAIGAYLYIDYTQQRLEKVERAEKEANRKANAEREAARKAKKEAEKAAKKAAEEEKAAMMTEAAPEFAVGQTPDGAY
jgi:flagellar biosynthesis/type III secretory pathway M-ring protein FliF/YscJ